MKILNIKDCGLIIKRAGASVQVFLKEIWTAGSILKENRDYSAKRPNRMNCGGCGPLDADPTTGTDRVGPTAVGGGAATGPRW